MKLGIIWLLALVAMCCGYGHQPMDEETYDTIAQLLRGQFKTQVKMRTKGQRNAVVRFWRNRDRFSLDDDGKTVLCDGKRVVKCDSIPNLVESGIQKTKGSGARKIMIRFREHYTGLSEARIQSELDKSRKYQHLQARFTNMPIPKPITAKEVQMRHQVDLLDMNKWKVTSGKVVYRYVLTVQDVFSRYVWLKPLKGKASSEIAKHLRLIYSEHGAPKIVQHDQGREFRGAVEQLMQWLKVKTIQSAPYHPQSQGKVERMHRTLRKKMLHDLLNLRNVNWVDHLPDYARILNNDPKKTLGWASPFEVYYGRKSNNVMESYDYEKNIEVQHADPICSFPTRRQRQSFHRKRSIIRQRAQRADEENMRRVILRATKSTQVSVYDVTEEVLVKIKHTNNRVTKKHSVVQGVIIKRNLNVSKYKVQYQISASASPQQKWFSVADITSVTRSQEKSRRALNQSVNVKRKHFLIAKSHTDHLDSFVSSGMTVTFDPLPDGNCQFAAMADQLAHVGIFRSPTTLRQEIASDLWANPFGFDGTHLLNYVTDESWDDYINNMRELGTYGDHITLQRAAEIFQVQFLVVSTLGVDASSIISPIGGYSEELPTLVLGHIAEGHGDHYVSLGGPISSYINSIQEEESHRIISTRHTLRNEVSPGFDPSILSSVVPEYQENSHSLAIPPSPATPPSSSSQPSPVTQPRPVTQLPPATQPPFATQQSPATQSPPTTKLLSATQPPPATLPEELWRLIIKYTLEMDMSMLGTINRISHLFSNLASLFLPWIYIRDSLAASLRLATEDECTISIMKLYKGSGRNSGVALKLKELFGKHPHWMKAWLILQHMSLGKYQVKDIFWK